MLLLEPPTAIVVGSRNLIPYSQGLQYVYRTYLGSYQLAKHERLWC